MKLCRTCFFLLSARHFCLIGGFDFNVSRH
uniref:Uncharacterized protein n=1 Tax=Anguilla anguilla TaxID=7936 RepID=A0A0E9UH39_ANGAN